MLIEELFQFVELFLCEGWNLHVLMYIHVAFSLHSWNRHALSL
jgi:hypothetical protein